MEFKLFAGSASMSLAQSIARHIGLPLAEARLGRFSDGEIEVEIRENVRGQDTFIVQSTCAPVNDNLMELLIVTDALRRASARSITAVVPYYGYARQDRKVAPRAPITAKLVANMMSTAGITRLVSMDLHAGQLQGFFDIPSDNLFAMPVMLEELRRLAPPEDLVLVSPDAGGVERTRAFSKRLGCTLAIVDKRRLAPNVAEVAHLVGEVRGKVAVLVDDMIDTAGTMTGGARTLSDHGAAKVFGLATHAVLSGPAVQRIRDSALAQLIVTDTVALSPAAAACPKIRAVSVAPLFAEAIRRIDRCDSLSSLFV